MSRDVLVERLVGLIDTGAARAGAARSDRERAPAALRVLLDGHPTTGHGALADLLVDPLRVLGRPAVRVSTDDFLRPASLRLEHGRQDPDALLDDRVDVGALEREVLRPLGPGGSGRYLPTLRDPRTDRSTRAGYVEAAPGTVLLLDGALALGLGLPVDLTVHLAIRDATIGRRTAPSDAWALPAWARYRREVDPEGTADVVVRVDHADRPALVVRRA
ncbi:uridine kinase [Paraoerskovia sediminicola]|uniref:Uridine kinase n=1 Tax=Paraoerskovia sediminicola TaxID=1138587 RepID=A0ABN6XAN9_9CELL|nr:uridine kinase [Paraoerskovia sediminicola]BDZ41829.1 uridine kinase [Paraoerskovia sediminicola]